MLLRQMTNSLLRQGFIKTSLPRANELRRVVEPLITLGKSPTNANQRIAFDRLRDREVVVKLFNEIGPRYKNQSGRYLRILKAGFRVSDHMPMAFVELVDRPVDSRDNTSARQEYDPPIPFPDDDPPGEETSKRK